LLTYSQQFSTLDADYHVEIEKVKAKDAEITNLRNTVEDLTGDRNAAKAKVQELQKQLEQANKDTQALRDEIAKPNKYISEDTIMDEQSRKILQDTQKKLESLMAEKSDLQNKLDTANSTITELNARIADYQQQIINRDTEISRIKAEIHAQKELNKILTVKNDSLTASVNELKGIQISLEEDLNRANARIEVLEKLNEQQRDKITKAEKERDNARVEVSAANEERDNAVKELEEIKQKMYKQKIVLK
jgi:chromosome segregation ATPase